MGGTLAWAEAAYPERSFIAIKPDGVHRGLVGDIIKRFEQRGYKLVAIKVLVPSRELAGEWAVAAGRGCAHGGDGGTCTAACLASKMSLTQCGRCLPA